MTEKEYRDYIYKKADNVKTKEQLDELLKEVIESKEVLDYGKIVYAMSACMIATSKYIDRSNVGGITGFQASFVGWEMVREFMIHDNKTSLKIVNYDEMLYPQYESNFQKTISQNTWKSLQKQAEIGLKESPDAHPEVLKHWESIVKGKVPFGYKVREN